MDAKTALEQVSEAENEVREMLETAKKKALATIEEARQRKQEWLADAERRAKADAEKARARMTAELGQEVAALRGKTAAEVENVRQRSSSRMEKALAFITKKLD